MKKYPLLLCSLLLGITLMQLSCKSLHSSAAAHPEERLGWKLGAQAYTFRLFTFAEALAKIDSAQLRFVEAFPGQVIGGGINEKMDYNLSAAGRIAVKRLLAEKNITLHAYGVVGAKTADEWDKVFAFAKDMGVQVINVEPQAEFLDVVSRLCDKYQIIAALHNHPDPSIYWTPESVLKALEGRSSRMRAAVDVGHWMRSGLDPVAALQKLSGKISHVHFKDLNAFGDKKAHDVHWGTGKLPIAEVLAELKKQKFQGMFSAEYEYNWSNNLPDVTVSVANFRRLLP